MNINLKRIISRLNGELSAKQSYIHFVSDGEPTNVTGKPDFNKAETEKDFILIEYKNTENKLIDTLKKHCAEMKQAIIEADQTADDVKKALELVSKLYRVDYSYLSLNEFNKKYENVLSICEVIENE